MQLSRLTAPVTGVLFVALMVVGVAISGNSPDSNATGLHVIHFYTVHRSHQRTADILFVFAAAFVVFFAGALRAHVRGGDGAEGASAVALVGGGLIAAGLTVLAGLDYALADVPRRLDPGAAQALNVLGNDVFFTVVVGGCVFMLASGVAILRGRTLPKWLGWVAVVLGVVMMTPLFWIIAIVMFVWILVVGALIYRRSAAAAPRSVAVS